MTESSDPHDMLLNQLADEFAARQRAGERPRLEEFCDRYPDIAADIRSLFPALVELERAKADVGSELAESAPDAPPITQLGDFRLLREVGRGGMGVVYEAEQVSLGRRVAIKLLPATVFRDPTKRRRFEREAKAAAKLHHTNIVPVHGFGEHDETPYYVMQFIPGLGLDAVIDELRRVRDPLSEPIDRPASALSIELARSLLGERGSDTAGWEGAADYAPTSTRPASTSTSPPDRGSSATISSSGVHLPGQSGSGLVGSMGKKTTYWESVARIGVQVAGALAYAHKLGVLHRDIKPANLLLDLDAIVWVTDFGLAKSDDSDDLTHTGDVLGTLRYMPPEAFEGNSDARSDIYALGLTLFELVALRPAYAERDRNKLVKEVTTGTTPRLGKFRRDAPRDLVTIIEKAIDKDPARRYQTAGALMDDLQRFLDGRSIAARRATEFERVWMWARRRPATAGLVAALFACLIAGSLISTAFAIRADGSARNAELREQEATIARDAARRNAVEAEQSRQSESTQRQRAETEKKRADITLADAFSARGLLAGERDAPAEAVLWFAAAADQAETAEDLQRLRDNRLRARNWMRRATLPVAAISAPSHVRHIEFQPRGNLLLVRQDPGELILWSWKDDKRLPWPSKLSGVESAQFSPDGASIAIRLRSGNAQIRNVNNGELLAEIRYKGSIFALAFSPDGKFLAVGGDSARLWDIEAKGFLEPVWNTSHPVTALAFNRNGTRLIATSGDRRARVFNVESGTSSKEPLFEPMAHTVTTSPALIDEDRVLVTISVDSELSRWSMATGKPASPPIRTKPRLLQSVVSSRDGNSFVTGGYYGPELFAADARQLPVHLSHTNLVKDSVFSPDNQSLLSVSMDQTARLWSVPTGQPLGQPLKHMTSVDVCAWSHDSRHFATAQYDGLIRVWQRSADDPVIVHVFGWGLMSRPRISFDGRLAAPGIWHESPMGDRHQNIDRLRVVSTVTGQSAGADVALPGMLVDSCICGDNLAVAAALERGGKGILGVWEVATARARFEPVPLPGPPISVAARPGSGQLAVICATGDLVVVDDKTGTRIYERRHEGWPNVVPGRAVQVDYTADGKTLVSLNHVAPATINVRDAETGQLRFAPLHSSVADSNLHSFCLSTDSRLLGTMALVKNNIQVWDLATGGARSEPLMLPGDYWGLFSVRFSPDGRHLVSSHKDGQVRYWDWQSGKLACPPLAHDNETHDAAITPDGRFVLSVMSGRAELRIWELKTGRLVSPPVNLGLREGAWCSRMAIAPDGRRALVSLWPGDLAVVDLESLLSTPTTPTTDLSLLAELATSRRIELGDLSGLTTDRWLERWAQLRQRNPELARSFLRETQPESAVQKRMAQASKCFAQKKFALATRLWAEALASDPKLGEDRGTQHRYNAACAAALAAAGHGNDEPPLDHTAKAKLRRQALDWLRTELTVWSKTIESDPAFLVRTLKHWQKDPDLAGLRDAAALSRFSADEQRDFTQLWADVAALLKKAEE